LIGEGSGGTGYSATDLVGTDPLLGPLQDNGGPTFTHALLPGSPAVDAGDNTGASEWDQRGEGFPRIVNKTIDISALEIQDGGGAGGGATPLGRGGRRAGGRVGALPRRAEGAGGFWVPLRGDPPSLL